MYWQFQTPLHERSGRTAGNILEYPRDLLGGGYVVPRVDFKRKRSETEPFSDAYGDRKSETSAHRGLHRAGTDGLQVLADL